MVLKLFTTFIVVAAILASPKHRDFTWSYRSSIFRVHCSLQVVETTCITLVDKKSWQSTCINPVDNLQQTCYHQAGASDANASWYRLDDCKVTSLQQIVCILRISGCVNSKYCAVPGHLWWLSIVVYLWRKDIQTQFSSQFHLLYCLSKFTTESLS